MNEITDVELGRIEGDVYIPRRERERERDGISGGGRGKVRKKENGGGMWASELIRGTN